jgi:hypothetical protein
MRLPSTKLLAALERRERKDRWLEEKTGGFHLCGTMGLDIILLPNGRMLQSTWRDLDERDVTIVELEDEPLRLTALRVAMKETPELGELFPERNPGDRCPKCTKIVDELGYLHVCDRCHGLGWIGEVSR